MKIGALFFSLFIAFLGITGTGYALDIENAITPTGTEDQTNTFYGRDAGDDNTKGRYNTFVGLSAGTCNTAGVNNSFFGNWAGRDNTIGHSNSFLAVSAGIWNLTGKYNLCLGRFAGMHNTTGGYNVNIGVYAGSYGGDPDTGVSRNVCLGSRAGYSNKTGSGNVYLGDQVGSVDQGSNHLFIDNSGTSYPLIYGDFDTNSVIIHGAFRSIASFGSSDKRWKKNIRPLESSLNKVNMLKGVSYEWKAETYPDMGLMEGQHIGLIAQDVESVFPELVSEDKDGYKAVSYTKLTAALVEAVKALKNKIEAQHKLIEAQRALSRKRGAMLQQQQAELEAFRALIEGLEI